MKIAGVEVRSSSRTSTSTRNPNQHPLTHTQLGRAGKRVPTGIVSSPNRDGRPGRTFHSPSPSPASVRLWIAPTDS